MVTSSPPPHTHTCLTLIIILCHLIDYAKELLQNKCFHCLQGSAVENDFVYICDSKVQQIVVGFLYAFKLILQVVALVLAFLTRKVKVKGLDDAKYIAAIIYITSIVIAIIAVCEFSLSQYINVYAVIFSSGLFVAPTCVLALVFIPTVSHVRRYISSFPYISHL